MLFFVLTGAVNAQDALRGKRIYHDGGRQNGTGISCVDCHGGVPGALHGIGRAAGNPAAIEYALGAIAQMARLRGHLSRENIEDLASYLASPNIASPRLSVSTHGLAANPYTAERLEFRSPEGTNSPVTTVRLTNAGERSLGILSSPALTGQNAKNFAISATDCLPNRVLAPQASCGIDVVFRARTSKTLLLATLRVDHDWIGGGVSVALLGHVGGAPVRRYTPMTFP